MAAYEEGSFTTAASRENLTQSGVSHHVRQMETLLGAKLFARDKNKVTSTPAADVLYRGCIKTLKELDSVTDQISIFSKGDEGSFTVGLHPMLTHRALAPALITFSKLNPNIKVRVVETSGDLAQMINAGQIDFAIGALQRRDASVRTRRIFTAKECLVTRTFFASNTQKPDKYHQPIKLVLPVIGEKRHSNIFDHLRNSNFVIDNEMQIDSALAIFGLVNDGWTTILPTFVFDPAVDEERFYLRPFRNPELNYYVHLFLPIAREIGPDADAFVQMMLEKMKNFSDSWEKVFDRHNL